MWKRERLARFWSCLVTLGQKNFNWGWGVPAETFFWNTPPDPEFRLGIFWRWVNSVSQPPKILKLQDCWNLVTKHALCMCECENAFARIVVRVSPVSVLRMSSKLLYLQPAENLAGPSRTKRLAVQSLTSHWPASSLKALTKLDFQNLLVSTKSIASPLKASRGLLSAPLDKKKFFWYII